MIQIIKSIVRLFKFHNKFEVSEMRKDLERNFEDEEIGKVIVKGLANLYVNKPEKPIKYLAAWLKNYEKNQKNLKHILKSSEDRSENLKLFHQANEVAAANKLIETKKIEDQLNAIEIFKKQIDVHDYQDELLQEIFPEFIQKHTNITGAYIGELNYPSRAITDEDSDPNAHLDLQAAKLVKYIGSSVSHKDLMRGKVLPADVGVTHEVFQLQEQKENEEEKEKEEQEVNVRKYVYVENVVKNEKMNYFRIPKLGAYLAVPLIYESYLTETIFDEQLKHTLKTKEDLKNFNQSKEDELAQLTKKKEEAAKKLSEAKEEPAVEEAEKELKEVEGKIEEKEKETFEEEKLVLSVGKKNYVVCVDNLGKDEQLMNKDIDLIVELTNYFREAWERKEREFLDKDIESQMRYLNYLPEAIATIKENYEKELALDEVKVKEIEAIDDETLKTYKTEEAEFNKLKKLLKEKELIANSFIKLKQFRVVKYSSVIQNLLFLLGKSKSQVNIPQQTVLNWKQVHREHINQDTFSSVLQYIVQGPKEGNFFPYAKTPCLLSEFEKFNEDEIFDYNIGLAMLCKFAKKALQHRLSNVKLRKEQKEVEREKRKELISENERLNEQKNQELQKIKNSLTSEEVEAFKEEEWSSKYDEDHPPKEVPAEIVDDIDNDV